MHPEPYFNRPDSSFSENHLRICGTIFCYSSKILSNTLTPMSTFRWLLIKQVLFQALGLLTDEISSRLSLTICSFPIYFIPTKIKRLYTNNSYSRSGLVCGDGLENWSSCISSMTSTLMKICSVPLSNETWKDKKKNPNQKPNRYSLE